MAEDRLSNRKDKDIKNKIRPNDDEEEETYLYDTKKMMGFINESKNGVFDIKYQSGINSAQSIFDKGSIFKTNL